MRIGNRLFPYPVLNHNKDLSDYIDTIDFSLVFDLDENGAPIIEHDVVVLKNARFQLSSQTLLDCVENHQAEVCFIVECSESLFRKRIPVSLTGTDISFPISDFRGHVSISCYLHANESFSLQLGAEAIDIYKDLSFDIERHDILAVDDGFFFDVDIDSNSDNQASSIFTIVKIEDPDSLTVTYESKERGIVLSLPAAYYDCYESMKTSPQYNNIAFAMLAIPALAGCLLEIQSEEHAEIEDIIDSRRWFKSVQNRYFTVTNSELTLDCFMNMNAFSLAQMVLNYASCNGLKDFSDLLFGQAGNGDSIGEDNDDNN